MADASEYPQNAVDDEVEMLQGNSTDGFEYRKRRHPDWLENYTLLRDRVIVNRLEQRQSANLPVMKTVLKSLLKDVDDMPVLHFKNLDNDKQAELFKNEYWGYTSKLDDNKFEVQDIIDKKQVFTFGRSFDQMQIVDGKVRFTIQDPQDIKVSRYTQPHNIHSSRFLIHDHIFVPLSVLDYNKDYDREKVVELKTWYATRGGLLKASQNSKEYADKVQKMTELGLNDVFTPILGETTVELSLHFVMRREKGDAYEKIWVYVMADNWCKLMKKPLMEIIGKTRDDFWQYHYSYNSWADDIEKQDFWSDSIADVVRTPNKIVNVWFSQLVENRTLRGLGMNYYNNSISEEFVPQTWDVKAWGWYGLPVPPNMKIDDVIKRVDIPDLKDSMQEMEFVISMIEKATGATATQQGAETQKQLTLGEVQLALGEAKERIKGMSKFYTQVWKERGLMFEKLTEAGADKLDAVRLYKKGRNTDNIYAREVRPNDWQTPLGHDCEVWSQEEKQAQDTQQLEKMNAMKANMPDNPVVDEEYKRRLVEFTGLPPDKVNAIMEWEQQKKQAIAMAQANGMMPQPGQTLDPLNAPAPQQAQLPARAGSAQ